MNDALEQFSDDARFDRLVDGEASPEEYRELLATLDDEPGGWRRCALAFLEAQALERELGDLREEAVYPSPRKLTEEKLASNTSRTSTNYWPMLLAMAASFLVAFGLRYAWRSNSPSDSPPELVVEENQQLPQDSELAGNSSVDREANPLREEDVASSPLQNVTLVVGDDDASAEQFEIPVVHYGDVGEEYFQTDHTAMPP